MSISDEIRERFLKAYFGSEPPTPDAIIEIAGDLYSILLQINAVIGGSNASELTKVLTIKSLLKRVFPERSPEIAQE